jgi:uncharacterized protein with NAD-binding domain and iron-sulfur cluster
MTSFLTPANNSSAPCPLPVPNSSKSFWHSEPDQFLLGHRTTPNLPTHADVVIVGCGITGANAARYLVESGKDLKTVVLEAREVCWGATGRVCESLSWERDQVTCIITHMAMLWHCCNEHTTRSFHTQKKLFTDRTVFDRTVATANPFFSTPHRLWLALSSQTVRR